MRATEIASARQAADLLTTGWPGEHHAWQRDAVDAFLKVLEGYRSTEDAEQAFHEAAKRARNLLAE